jgi:hypothetical protein
MKQKGHWFCDHCDDVVFLSYEHPEIKNIPCPDCGHLACNFIPAKISRKILGEWWFDHMRRMAEEKGTPELYDQRKYKQIL